MLEKDIQLKLEQNPTLLTKYNLGECIKSEFTQINKRRLDSVFENGKERFVVEYQLNSLDLDHITRGIVYHQNEQKENPDHQHSLFFISTKTPNIAALEFLNFNSQIINIKTFKYDKKLEIFDEYCYKELLIKKNEELEFNKLKKIENKPTKVVKKKPELSYFEVSGKIDMHQNIITELHYQDFFFKDEFEQLKKFLKTSLKIRVMKNIGEYPYNLEDLIDYNEDFNFNLLIKKDFDLVVSTSFDNESERDKFSEYIFQKFARGNNYSGFRLSTSCLYRTNDKFVEFTINYTDKYIQEYLLQIGFNFQNLLNFVNSQKNKISF